jgi:hypothetical protein
MAAYRPQAVCQNDAEREAILETLGIQEDTIDLVDPIAASVDQPVGGAAKRRRAGQAPFSIASG